MKVITALILTLFFSDCFAMEFSYRDLVRVQKVSSENVVPANLIELFRSPSRRVERMIAGRFETKFPTRSYQDGLREKLRDSRGIFRF